MPRGNAIRATFEIEMPLLEAYSRGEITRHDIETQMDTPVSFALLLVQLQAHGLPLPRLPSDTTSPRFQLIRRLAKNALQHK